MSGVSVNHAWTLFLSRMSYARVLLGTLTVPNQAERQIKLCPCSVTLGKPRYLSVSSALNGNSHSCSLPGRLAGTIRVQLRVLGASALQTPAVTGACHQGPSRGKGLLSTTVHKGPWLSTSQMSLLNPSHLDSPMRSSPSPASEGETKAKRVHAELDLVM